MELTSLVTERLSTAEKKQLKRIMAELFERYRIFRYILGLDDREARVTSSPEPRYHGNTNTVSNEVQSIAIHNVDVIDNRRLFVDRIDQFIVDLPEMEQLVLKELYTSKDAEYLTDQRFYEVEHPMSYKKFDDIRTRAFLKLAIKLGLWPLKA